MTVRNEYDVSVEKQKLGSMVQLVEKKIWSFNRCKILAIKKWLSDRLGIWRRPGHNESLLRTHSSSLHLVVLLGTRTQNRFIIYYMKDPSNVLQHLQFLFL